MNLLTRAVYLVCILLVGGIGTYLIREQEVRQQFEVAKLELLEGRYQRAERAFQALEKGWLLTEASSTGRILARALQSENSNPGPIESLLDSSKFPLELLLSQALSRREFGGLLQLSRTTLNHPSSALFEVAALTEMGLRAEARQRWAILGDPPEHWLAKRLQEAFSLDHSTQLIRDRRGRLLAWKEEGKFNGSAMADRQILRLLEEMPALGLSAAQGGQELSKLPFSVRSSLDLDLIEVAKKALRGYRGTIVLLEPSTGEVLAAVSDEVTAREPLPALHQRREPASIAKLITTSAALRSDVDPDDFLDQARCDGAKRYQGGILYCAYTAGRLHGLDRSMAISCNIGFADLAVELGRRKLLDEYRRFGFDEGSFFGRIRNPGGNQRQLADLGIGLEATDITPLHAALLAAVVANQGKMASPVLYSASDGILAASPRFERWRSQRMILPASDSEVLKQAMMAVVADGTGQALAQKGFPVAMKTGTGRDPGKGGYHINYIGFGPVKYPSFAFSVRVTHQSTSPRVRRAGVAVTRRLLAGLKELQVAGQWPYPPALFGSHTAPYLAQHQASR